MSLNEIAEKAHHFRPNFIKPLLGVCAFLGRKSKFVNN